MSDSESTSETSSTNQEEFEEKNSDKETKGEKASDIRQAVFRSMRRRPMIPKKEVANVDSLPWIEKYRPKAMSEVISHDNKIKVLSALIPSRSIPHLLLYGSPGTGKCLSPETNIRLFDGKLKQAKNIEPGDLLMGDDLTPRRVLSTCSGTDKMYRVSHAKGKSHGSYCADYVCNKDHILTLMNQKTREVIDICIEDYLAKPYSWAQNYGGFSVVPYGFRGSGNMRFVDGKWKFFSNEGFGNQEVQLDPPEALSLTIEDIGEGEYAGFELDGNGRFCLHDYTVTHNTSLALAMARTMYGENWKRYVLELNASDDRGIDIVRNRIPLFAKSRADDMRIIVLDEADAMTADAQSALRRIMELYVRTCRFILICNNINKIIPGVTSRCAKMRFGCLDRGSIRQKLYTIVADENIEIEEDAMDKLLENFQDFRQILNMMQCLRSIRLGDKITSADVKEYLGKADKEDMLNLIQMLETEPFKKCYNSLLSLHWENRINLIDLIQSMVRYLVDDEKMSEERRSVLLDGLASVEYRIITGSDTEVQLASLVGVWFQAREIDN